MGVAPDYILVEGQTFSKARLSLDNHVYKNCAIDDCDIYFSGGQYELLDTHITNSRLILNHSAKGMYNAVQIFKMKAPGSSIIAEERDASDEPRYFVIATFSAYLTISIG